MRTAIAVLSVWLVGFLPIAGVASAQGYPFSQRAHVSQSVAFTAIEITYGRPSVRGRALFGALVPWDSIWHPGADSATRITFNHDIAVEGKTLRAGALSVWLIPREHAPWAVIFSRKSRAFHKPYPGPSLDVLRIDVAPEVAPPVETLALYFPDVLRDEGCAADSLGNNCDTYPDQGTVPSGGVPLKHWSGRRFQADGRRACDDQ